MIEFEIALVLSSFIAGVLMFLAPCTLPLVPAYLAFISGVKEDEIDAAAKRKIRRNGAMFVIGFSVIFIVFGILAGLFGSFVGQYRMLLSQIGGGFIILFGLMMLGVFSIAPLAKNWSLAMPKGITPGQPLSAFLIGAIFALGWTPCVGPVLASVLLIASTKATVFSGAFLLAVFSLGLAVPFMVVALLYTKAAGYIQRYSYISKTVSVVGGAFLILIGILLLMGDFAITTRYGYDLFNYLGIGSLFNFY